ncbi:hypothetical protein BFW38_04160 [Terasakiispira papahanaumokuakeensis]|uniref:DNA gyrase inhibitor YacG n=1 Tax=Terasakiispira papahanaumokuakeensis TaxID=197479 RepID=A0A1E2V883_9GAMM|nr:DNA gyrase inhibitor YacG [Terasakiispira papahanaumokuakeensis]ODC02865.1 hypothetical protein BFW38_04160 [Terasakiispira papahanaumokuakeensis]
MPEATTTRLVACPTCRQSIAWTTDNPNRPFCSERCRMIDLGAWAAEDHRIPGEKALDEQDPNSYRKDPDDWEE